MQHRGYGLTDVGRERLNNEDAFVVDDGLGLYVVSDGIGGYAGGELASAAAVQAVVERIGRGRNTLAGVRNGRLDVQHAERLVLDAIEAANVSVRALSSGLPNETRGPGCTLTVLLVVGAHAVLGHVGDSRAYLCRGGEARQLTEDHTVATELYKNGLVSSREALRRSRYAHILTRAIGAAETVDLDLFSVRIADGDRFLLCSDGLSEHLPETDGLSPELCRGDLRRAPEELIDYANARGGWDNITAVVVGIGRDDGHHTRRRDTLRWIRRAPGSGAGADARTEAAEAA